VPYRVVLSDEAARQIRELPQSVQRQVIAKIEALAAEPRPAGSKKLVGQEGLWRVRSGDYRILYTIDGGELLVLVVLVQHRRDVYRRLRSRR
jgi:mRNA interferase RelE/StbE